MRIPDDRDQSEMIVITHSILIVCELAERDSDTFFHEKLERCGRGSNSLRSVTRSQGNG